MAVGKRFIAISAIAVTVVATAFLAKEMIYPTPLRPSATKGECWIFRPQPDITAYELAVLARNMPLDHRVATFSPGQREALGASINRHFSFLHTGKCDVLKDYDNG